MPGREIKGQSKIATYRHGGRAGYREGKQVIKYATQRPPQKRKPGLEPRK